MKQERSLKTGEPCDHKGCLRHISHPCEGCGRIGGRTETKLFIIDASFNGADRTVFMICTRRGPLLQIVHESTRLYNRTNLAIFWATVDALRNKHKPDIEIFDLPPGTPVKPPRVDDMLTEKQPTETEG